MKQQLRTRILKELKAESQANAPRLHDASLSICNHLFHFLTSFTTSASPQINVAPSTTSPDDVASSGIRTALPRQASFAVCSYLPFPTKSI